MYFRLNNACFIKKDKTGSVIYNIQYRDLVELDMEETKLLSYAEAGNALCEEQTKSQVLNELMEMGWGFFSENNCFVDKVRPYNSFILTRPDLFAVLPEIVYLQIVGNCSLGCDVCKSKFCSPCKCLAGSGQLEIDVWLNIIDKLVENGTKNFILTGGNILEYGKLPELVEKIQQKNVEVTVILNEVDDRVYKLNKNIHIIWNCCCFEYSEDKIAKMKEFFSNLYVMSEKDIKTDNLIRLDGDYNIYKEKFTKPDIEKYYMRKDRDSCLTGKLFISSDGNVIPCFEMCDAVIGNVVKQNLRKIIKELAVRYWNFNAENYSRCSKCKWFYACGSCQATDVEKRCTLQ